MSEPYEAETNRQASELDRLRAQVQAQTDYAREQEKIANSWLERCNKAESEVRAQAALLESYRKADIEADKMRKEIQAQAATIATMRMALESACASCEHCGYCGPGFTRGDNCRTRITLNTPTSNAEARYNALDDLLRHIIDAGNDKDTWASCAQSAEALRFIVEKAREVRKLEGK